MLTRLSLGSLEHILKQYIWNLMQQPGYDIIAQFIIGYILPGKPIANLLFKIYGRISTVHALSFLSDLKLGHYMKIPPRCMYTAQVIFFANLSFIPVVVLRIYENNFD